jgi:hypothetical protein
MVSRIYTVRNKTNGKLVRYVRAHSLNGAVRALAGELFDASAATTDDIFKASKDGTFDVLDALEPEQVDAIETAKPRAVAPDRAVA